MSVGATRKMMTNVIMMVIMLVIVMNSMVNGYKPAVFMHGLDGHATDWSTVQEAIQKAHPGQISEALAVDEGGESHKVMATQVADVITAIKGLIANDPTSYKDGFHLVGHSQGGLLTRAVLMTAGLPIVNYVSCAGPQYGVYGNYSSPGFSGLTPAQITDLFYTPKYQASESVANYWHDGVDYKRYVQNAVWLSTLNNETYNPNSNEFKANFLRANKTVFNISPQDGTIIPWVSSIFGFWNEDLTGFVDIKNQSIFIDDSFGLQTAYNRGSLILNTPPNVLHVDWLHDPTVITNYILPYLD